MGFRGRMLAGALGALLGFHWGVAKAADVDMAEIRRLALTPVEHILSGTHFVPLSDGDYWVNIRHCQKPVVVLFYANHDERSRRLATLARYLAQEFGNSIAFFSYPVNTGARAGHDYLARLKKKYGLTKVPATLFYDQESTGVALERTAYAVPSLIEYRSPNLLFWKTYHQMTRDYIRRHILH